MSEVMTRVVGGPWVITQPFGCTTFNMEIPDPACPGGYFHSGVDLAAPRGHLVVSGGFGVVSRIGTPPIPGICHGGCTKGCLGPNAIGLSIGGRTVWFGHLEERYVRLGQHLAPMSPLGRVGTMGCSTGPHLHFEVDPGDNAMPLTLAALDPMPYLMGW